MPIGRLGGNNRLTLERVLVAPTRDTRLGVCWVPGTWKEFPHNYNEIKTIHELTQNNTKIPTTYQKQISGIRQKITIEPTINGAKMIHNGKDPSRY